jgi:hypothetical protein
MISSHQCPMPPFGLDMAKYQTMYGEALSTALTVLIMLAQPSKKTVPSGPLMAKEPELRLLLARPELSPSQFGLTTVMQFEFCDDLMVHRHKAFRAEEHADWLLDVGLVQVGFVDPMKLGKAPLPVAGVFHAMQIFDSMVSHAESIDAAEHEPYPACEVCYAVYRQDVGDIYRQRKAVMTHALVEYHNAIAIAVRACLCGEDGVAAYEDFKSKGGIYFLQFPSLCE